MDILNKIRTLKKKSINLSEEERSWIYNLWVKLEGNGKPEDFELIHANELWKKLDEVDTIAEEKRKEEERKKQLAKLMRVLQEPPQSSFGTFDSTKGLNGNVKSKNPCGEQSIKQKKKTLVDKLFG